LSLLDFVIVLAVLIGIANGYRRGLLLSISQYVGLVAGVVFGAAIAPAATAWIGLSDPVRRPAGAVIVLLVAGALGSALGYTVGSRLDQRQARGLRPSRAHSSGGALLSGLAVLSVAWFLGLTFARGPSPQLANLIEQSAILRQVDQVAPRPPTFLAGVERILAGVPFPQTFAGLQPSLPAPMTIDPGAADTPGVRSAARSTLKIEGRGCGGLVSGSGFPVAGDMVLTNAHVVAGTDGTTVTAPGTGPRRGSVVYFDPNRDVALISVANLGVAPLPTTDQGGRGTPGAVIGYPGGGPEQVSAAVIDGAVTARGRDIYNENLVNRMIWVVEAEVQPGNSGGPLVDTNGRVLGMIFAASGSNRSQAYALTNAEIASDVQSGSSRRSAIDTRQFPCAL
jgi:S1-C subfamily serine protease